MIIIGNEICPLCKRLAEVVTSPHGDRFSIHPDGKRFRDGKPTTCIHSGAFVRIADEEAYSKATNVAISI
jgi:hypothetical protein